MVIGAMVPTGAIIETYKGRATTKVQPCKKTLNNGFYRLSYNLGSHNLASYSIRLPILEQSMHLPVLENI